MDRDLSDRIREQDREIEFLRGEVQRLRAALARSADSAEDLLRRRGFRIFKKGSREGVIMPRPATAARLDEFYSQMKRYSFRLFLRDVIKLGEGFTSAGMVRYSSLPTVEEFCSYLSGAGIISGTHGGYSLALKGITSFGPTLEWFVSEVFRREYMADTVWGVRFRDTASGGDYDVIAAIEGRLVYAEVKSSPPKQLYVNEVSAFMSRVAELGPELSMFVVDTELRMKDKVVVLFEEALPASFTAGSEVARFRAEMFHVDGRIFIVNSKDSLVANIGEVLAWHLRRS